MIKLSSFYKNISFVFVLFFVIEFQAQNDSIFGVELIDFYISKQQVKQADSVLNKQIDYYTNANQIDSLYKFPLYIGKVTSLKSNTKIAEQKAKKFIDNLKQKTSDNRTLYKAYLSLYDFYSELEDDTNSLIASKEAFRLANTLKDITNEELGTINYIIGGSYYYLYDLAEAVNYFKKSVLDYEKSNTVKKHILADSYNGIAVCMWALRKLDSANIYFNKAIFATEKSDLKAFDRLYYVNAFKFNQALVYDDLGNTSQAINLKKEIIKNLQNIIEESKDEELVLKSKRLQASSLSNLAAIYNDTGNLTKAYNMLKYAYQKKKKVFNPDSPKLAIALNQIALSEINLKEFDKSLATSKKALKILKESTDEYLPIEADILYLQAKAYAEKNDSINAFKFYEESESLYKKSYPNNYSIEYLILLRDYALFLANHNHKENAIKMAEKIYRYILKTDGNDSFILLKEIANISNIYYLNKDYENALLWAEKGNEVLNENLHKASTAIDSIKIEYNRTDFLLLECKSRYKLSTSNEAFLKSLNLKLDKAIELLEKRKKTLFNQKDIAELLTEYESITSLAKQINYNLYTFTKDNKYLNKLISLHESSIYNNIRLRLNLKNNLTFSNIPQKVLTREKEIKESITKSLDDISGDLTSFLNSENNWNVFLDSLKQTYPKYYKMRYATIEEPLNNIHENIPKNTTVLRYLFIDETLYVIVINTTKKHIIKLNNTNVKDYISQLGQNQSEIEKTSIKLYQLYQQLWKPVENKISTENIIIIPDSELFNLSFESLTPTKINSFKDLATNSLLAKYTISYNYSLLLLDKNRKTINYEKDFVAFAPEFNDKMKKEYRIAISDSISIDKTYLKLLPQPFSVDLAKDYSKLFNGDFFINEKASKQIFKNEANEHKIIHIGTHAESNNLTPELSRLIFAKNDTDEDNSLYTYEIYNENLNSNLAILTACETGKPTYQAGEGMISLAHAFNYAGSESILTSLWKIDEQSSSKIIENFYNYIKKGLPKDEALQKAKLDYISNAEGRTISPQYWAGLVLIGDTTAIDINTSSNIIWYLFTILLISIGLAYIRKKYKN